MRVQTPAEIGERVLALRTCAYNFISCILSNWRGRSNGFLSTQIFYFWHRCLVCGFGQRLQLRPEAEQESAPNLKKFFAIRIARGDASIHFFIPHAEWAEAVF